MTYTNDTGLPSVTQILRPWIDAEWFTPEATARGSWVHEAVAAELSGSPSWMLPEPAEPKWWLYVESAERWISEAVANVIVVEQRFSDHFTGYTGQVDLIASLKSGEIALIDWKTSQAASGWWPLQLVAYAHLSHCAGHHVDRMMAIRPKPDGSGCLPAVEVDVHQVSQVKNTWMACLVAWKHFNKSQSPLNGSVLTT